MKKFKVTVNGKAYEVEVEEMGGAPAAPAPTPAAAPAVGGPIPEGAITVKAPMPGKISALKAEAGKAVKRGDIILVLEAMKMQNDITATADGTLHEIRVNPGDNVKTGDVLAVIVK
jgi:biotin carboxyl carrier protein